MDDLTLLLAEFGAAARIRSVRHQLIAQLAERHGLGAVSWNCSSCGSHDHGQPVSPLGSISTSHHDGYVAVVFDPLGRRLGIDLTSVAPPPEAHGIADALFTPGERLMLAVDGGDSPTAFSRIWAAKEALGKARGCGLAIDNPCEDGGPLDTLFHKDWIRPLMRLPQGLIGAIAIECLQ